MSGIYIPGMAMPKHIPIDITIWPDGHYKNNSWNKDGEVIQIPDHGRLIDADASLYNLGRIVLPDDLAYTIGHDMAKRFFEKAPTVIPADKEA